MTSREHDETQQVEELSPEGVAGRQGIEFKGWPKGLNKDSDPTRLHPQELAEAKNVILGPRGELQLRHGHEAYEPFTDSHGYERIINWPDGPGESVFAAYRPSDDRWYILGDDAGTLRTQLASASGHGPRSRHGAGYSMLDKFYLSARESFSSNTGAIEVSGDWPTLDMTFRAGWDGESDTTTAHPRTDVLTLAYERVFAARVSRASLDQRKYRLFFSEPLEPLTWKANNFIDVAPDDGQAVTGLHVFADQIIIFKEHSIYGLAGHDFAGLGIRLYLIQHGIGCTAPRTITELGPVLMFFDPGRGVYMFDGSGFSNVSTQIFEYIRDGMNHQRAYDAQAWSDGPRYFLSVPWGSSITNTRTFVFDGRTSTWTEWDRGFNTALAPVGELIEADASATRDMIVVHPSDLEGFHHLHTDFKNDNGTPIEVTARTGWIAPMGGILRHRIRQFNVEMVTSNIEAEIRIYRDFGALPQAVQVFLPSAATSDWSDNLDWDFSNDDWGGEAVVHSGRALSTHKFNGFRWRNASFEIHAVIPGDNEADWQLNSMRTVLSTLPRVRGHDAT